MPRRLQCIFCQTAFVVGDEAPLGDCPGCGTELLDSTYIVDLGPVTDNHIALEATRTLEETMAPLQSGLDPTTTMPGASPDLEEAPELSGEDVTRASLSAGALAASVAAGALPPDETDNRDAPKLSAPPTEQFDASFDDVTPGGAWPAGLAAANEGKTMEVSTSLLEEPSPSGSPTSSGNGSLDEAFGEGDTHLNSFEGGETSDEPVYRAGGDAVPNDDTREQQALNIPRQPWEDEEDEEEGHSSSPRGFYVEDEATLSSNLDLEALAAASTGSEAGARPRWRCPICSAEFPGSRPRACPACGSQISSGSQ